MSSVAEVTEGDGFNERRPLPLASPFHRLPCGRVALEHIVAIDDHAGNPVAICAMSHIRGAELPVVWRGVGELVVLYGEYDREFEHCRSVYSFVPGARRRRSLPAVGHRHPLLAALVKGHGTAHSYRIRIGERRNHHQSALVDDTKVAVAIAP